MRPRAHRSLHVLVCAPVLAVAAITSAPWACASARADLPATPASASVKPVVVVLDPGHGGSANNADPSQPYDSGAVSTLGQLEKDITLDVARRTAVLLAADDAEVVLTRNSDVFMDIPSRTQVAIDHHADVFTSIHMNGFNDPSASGSLVLFPYASDYQFATTMAAALDRVLGPYGVASRGTMLRDNWWLHVPCPVVTVEPLFLSNPTEARLIARDDVRQALAGAIRDGVEAEVPAILQRKPALEAYRAAHSGALPAASSVAASGTVVQVPAGVRGDSHSDPVNTSAPRRTQSVAPQPGARAGLDLRRAASEAAMAAVLLGLAWRFRRRLLRAAAILSAGVLDLVARLEGGPPSRLGERFSHRRRHLARRRRLLERSRRSAFLNPPRAYPRIATTPAAIRPTATTTPRSTGSGRRRARSAPR